ncbi:MFS transporter [Microbacterium sp. cx-59]|uniref:MFS transporter n=1 Tax=Microbacterium sp. cx-59 TaxID=2891207 RepID=UPI0027E1448C|nr:MFS transporter [Microbacterium sp. cx-59]
MSRRCRRSSTTSRDIPLSPWLIGLIGTAPPVCYAVFGIVTPGLERRFGLQRLAVIALAVATVGLLGRAAASDATLLLAATALVFAAVGVGNVLLPPLVKRYFPGRIGAMTTVFTTAMAIATFLPPLVAVPVADAAGWRSSLGLWAVFAVAALAPWFVLLWRERTPVDEAADRPDESVPPRVLRRLWALPTTWALVVGFAVTSGTAYTAFAWLPQILIDLAGVTPAQAGTLLSLFAVMGLPSSLLVPVVVARFRGAVGILFGAAVASGLGGLGGLAFAPAAAPWLWAALLGMCPLLFPLVLVLLNLRTRTHEGAVALSGIVQSVGYAIAALFPFGVGIAHTLTGGWGVPLGMLAVLLLAGIPAAIIASRPRTVEEDWSRRHGAW